MIDFDWMQIGAFGTAAMAGGGIMSLALRGWLAGRYAPVERVEQLEERVGEIEIATRGMLRQGDLREVERRIGGLEVGLAGVQADVRGTGEATKRIEHMVNLLVDHGLGGEQA